MYGRILLYKAITIPKLSSERLWPFLLKREWSQLSIFFAYEINGVVVVFLVVFEGVYFTLIFTFDIYLYHGILLYLGYIFRIP